MIKKIIVTNHYRQTLELELSHPEKTGLAVLQVTGIGPPTTDTLVFESPNRHGGYNGPSRAKSRDIQMTIKYLDDVETNRHLCYRFFQATKPVALTFITDQRTVEIEGRVETNEALIFSSDCGSSITIRCADAYFHKPTITVAHENEVESLFSFPFPYGGSSTFSFGTILQHQSTVESFDVYNHGDVEIGAEFRFLIEDTFDSQGISGIHNFSVKTNDNEFVTFSVDTEHVYFINDNGSISNGSMQVGDVLIFDTVKKDLLLERYNKKCSNIQFFPRNVEFPMLDIGGSLIYMVTDYPLILSASVRFTELYQGV